MRVVDCIEHCIYYILYSAYINEYSICFLFFVNKRERLKDIKFILLYIEEDFRLLLMVDLIIYKYLGQTNFHCIAVFNYIFYIGQIHFTKNIILGSI